MVSMPKTLFFYDLETSGLNGRDDRIMQFAGQRTDLDLNPIGEPYNLLVAMSDDTLPSPYALMVTGVTPQKTVEEGYSEAEFARIFMEEVATPDTTIVGYNSIRFDDEFTRALLWRNFFDPYEWGYSDGRSRWDLLDVVRMTRALRPGGIEWPVVDDKPSNRLEELAKANNIEHLSAHDALSDVEALIGVAQLIKHHQPDLYNYLYKLRDKAEIKKLVNLDEPKPFVYTSGRYASEFEKTTVALPVAEAEYGNVYVYDLRHDPTDWASKSKPEIAKILNTPYKERDETYVALPIKKLQYNRAPAVAPLGVLEQSDGWKRIGLDGDTVARHQKILATNPEFIANVSDLLAQKPDYAKLPDAENQLYDGFIDNRDKLRVEAVRNATPDELAKLNPKFADRRLAEMYPRYKAHNFPRTLSDDERAEYEAYRTVRIARQTSAFMRDLQALAAKTDLSDHQQFVLEELKLWYESIAPVSDSYS